MTREKKREHKFFEKEFDLSLDRCYENKTRKIKKKKIEDIKKRRKKVEREKGILDH